MLQRKPILGSNGYSLKLDGYEKGINDKAMQRAIVMHAANYANEEVIGSKGLPRQKFRLPRSTTKSKQENNRQNKERELPLCIFS